MRKAVLLAVVIFFVAMTASSQIRPTLYGGGGLGLPSSGQLSDWWKTGPNFGGSFGIRINPMFEISARFHYNSFPVDEPTFRKIFVDSLLQVIEDLGYQIPPELLEEFLSVLKIEGPTMKLIEFGVDVRFFIPIGENGGPFRPFLLAGAGGTQKSLGNITASFFGESITGSAQDILPVPDETGISFCFGGGFNYMFAPMIGMYIEGRYNILMVDPENYGWFQARGGLCLEFGG